MQCITYFKVSSKPDSTKPIKSLTAAHIFIDLDAKDPIQWQPIDILPALSRISIHASPENLNPDADKALPAISTLNLLSPRHLIIEKLSIRLFIPCITPEKTMQLLADFSSMLSANRSLQHAKMIKFCVIFERFSKAELLPYRRALERSLHAMARRMTRVGTFHYILANWTSERHLIDLTMSSCAWKHIAKRPWLYHRLLLWSINSAEMKHQIQLCEEMKRQGFKFPTNQKVGDEEKRKKDKCSIA